MLEYYLQALALAIRSKVELSAPFLLSSLDYSELLDNLRSLGKESFKSSIVNIRGHASLYISFW